ncbi:hypothetical protein [Arthrobacter sp. lap29]|uniref:hypothetical protein n=1 Tax=Arthrobacter sp. lap29 TaxID=3056122 RepID=UPI0028F722AA|nr:hypothetical protein [Arthrobacter sp. lap29]
MTTENNENPEEIQTSHQAPEQSGAADREDPADAPVDLPSAEAPITDENSGPTRVDRESFSSEPDQDATGGEE